ncbi:DegT/DnrJ/EryC1/StrS family aminotransferase [Azospirillum doebereinerae]|uniref:DegT/DnrJ/EryC1/StrS family aminotransferase n=1 Tax=Azospirillum doebereinerae TaxID=92933 RepID=A0A3S0VJV1_9PROT|nr:DegT/DnrJ/EryC1/StrS family aminotransferase [Azospirillum doebereinerae]MCG5239628.1 DegT/DnrJ/EryC1/StrS family aminotransferase [Azospirillum doebereinerae]RUQ74136.1 DegT/DnrJ/EryC1/StrS family aminotransferase [Azospirillum doebereinerae]
MTDSTPADGADNDEDGEFEDYITQTDPDLSQAEVEVLTRVLTSGGLGDGRMTRAFETAFAAYVGRAHAVTVSSGTMAALLLLKALGVGPGDEVLCSPFGWHQTQHAVALSGATPVLVDIDYWQHTINPEKAAGLVTPATKAILAGNVNGHPAHWDELTALAKAYNLTLIEDSSEAIGSTYKGRMVGTFGDASYFDFSEPGILLAGEGGMVVTDDKDLAHRLRYLRHRETEHRNTVVITRTVPWQARMSTLGAALGLVQLKRLPEIVARRNRVIGWYDAAMASFEGIKPPYRGPGAGTVNPMVYSVHLGTRFTASGRKAIIEDLDGQGIDASDYGQSLHTQQYYQERGATRADCPVCTKTGDRVLALPLHHKVTEDQIAFIVETLKDATVNTGAGAAIY